jgi:hypothetical protein
MTSSIDNPGGRNAYEEKKRAQGNYITERHLPFLDYAFGFGTVLSLTISAAAFSYQNAVVGIYFLIGGAAIGLCGIFIHLRHRIFHKRIPATLTLVAFTVVIVGSESIGGTLWYAETIKDRDNFNIVAGSASMVFERTSATLSQIVLASSLQAETLVTPVDRLWYLQITNKQPTISNLVGISVELSNGQWWPRWTKLCHVNLRAGQLLFLNSEKRATLYGPENMIDTTITSPIEPMHTVAGWSAWQCPPGSVCVGAKFKVGLTDSAGAVFWQVLSEPEIVPNLQGSALHVVQEIELKSPIRTYSVCAR